MGKTWRDSARPIIAKVIKENRGMPETVIKKALFEAYPFGERRMHPYKIWLDEIKIQTGKKKRGVEKMDLTTNLKITFE